MISYLDKSIVFDNNTTKLSLSPFSDILTLEINGGDGSYSINNTNKEAINATLNGNSFTLEPVTLGDAEITISDNSGNSCKFSVRVAYQSTIYEVFVTEAIVEGDNLTIVDKKKFEEEILKNISVQAKGKYELIHCNCNNNIGCIKIYPAQTGESIEGEFQYETKENAGLYTIKTKDKTYSYHFTTFGKLDAKSTPAPLFQFTEDVTDKYKQAYPALEKAYAIQGLRTLNNHW